MGRRDSTSAAGGGVPSRRSCACQTTSGPAHVWSWNTDPSAGRLQGTATSVGQGSTRGGVGRRRVPISHERSKEREGEERRIEAGVGNGDAAVKVNAR